MKLNRIIKMILGFGLLLSAFHITYGQTGFHLTPMSGADGIFETVTIDGTTIFRSSGSPGEYTPYMYFYADEQVHSSTVYVEITYII